MTEYRAEPLAGIPINTRTEDYKVISALCGAGGIDIKDIFLSETPDPQLILGRLYAGDQLVGGILYSVYGDSVSRVFVCVQQGKGYLSEINKGFEQHVLASKKIDGPMQAQLSANVRPETDPLRKVPLAHMLQGYKPISKNPLSDLIHEKYGVIMKRTLGAPLPTEGEQTAIRQLNDKANALRAEYKEKALDRVKRRNDMTAKRQKIGGRHHKRFSTRRNKKHNGRRAHRRSGRR